MDVQVGAPERDRVGGPACLAGSAGRTARVRVVGGRRGLMRRSSRSGQIGKKTAHHCSGASSMMRSKAAAMHGHRGLDPLAPRTRRPGRRSPRGARGSGRCDARRTADHVGGGAALDREHGRAEREHGRGPEQRHERPAAGQVAVPDEADRRPVPERGQQLPSRLAKARRCGRRPLPRVRVNQAWSAASSMVSIGATAPPTRDARKSAGSSMAPKWRPMNMTVRPGSNARATTSGSRRRGAGRRRPSGARASGRPRGSTGRCGGTPSGPAVRGLAGRSRPPDAADSRGPMLASATQTRRRLRRAWAARSGANRYQPSPANSAARVERPFRQVTGEPRRGEEDARPQRPSQGRHDAVSPFADHRRHVAIGRGPRPVGAWVLLAGLHDRARGAPGRPPRRRSPARWA